MWEHAFLIMSVLLLSEHTVQLSICDAHMFTAIIVRVSFLRLCLIEFANVELDRRLDVELQQIAVIIFFFFFLGHYEIF